MKKYGVSIKGIGTALPKTVVTNDHLAELVDTSDEWIVSRTGFRERRVVSGDEMLTDLAIESAQDALDFAGMKGEDIDLIIHASSTPDYIYPMGCGVLQQGIGATRAFGFDTAMGCSGLVYALGIAAQFIENGTVKTALVTAADTHSRYMDWYDRNTCVLFGDGAGSFILTRTENPEDSDILALDFMLDGSKGPQIKLPINRDNCPVAEPRTFQEKSSIYMNGREVFKFAIVEVPKIIERAVQKAGLRLADMDYLVLHQANARIMTAMAERFNIGMDKIVMSLEKYGNTSAASIALALYDAVESGQIRPGHRLLLCGFGAGLAVATTVVKWNCVDQRKINSSQTVSQKSIETV
jgi:3-oxoacyl-[acyl-carrier-protein] synthase III